MIRLGSPALLLVFLATSVEAGQDQATGAAYYFERDIRPILRVHCLDCHGAADELKGDLDLRLRRSLVRGGQSGPAIVPEKPDESYLYQRIVAGEMPPGEKKLTAAQQAMIARWIADGAPTLRDEPDGLENGIGITAEERAFWSFQPIVRPKLPQHTEADRVRTPVDALVLVALKENGIGFAPDADRITLLRRASLDLAGLPPSPEDTQGCLADVSSDAYTRLVDRLLNSSHYGESWARHWLDVAGYADSEGDSGADTVRDYAYKYRDYIIRSLNSDKSFDQFLVEQLAGDELAGEPHREMSADHIEKLTATGFLRMAVDGTGGGDQDAGRNQVVADTIKIVSTALLGLSVGCAQCHDHRYDPISQEDYYRVRAVFEPAYDWKQWRGPRQRLVSLYTDADRDQAARMEAEANKVAVERAAKEAQYLAAALHKELEKYDPALRESLRAAYHTPADKRAAEQTDLLKKYPSVNISPGVLYQYNQAAADDLKKYDERMAAFRAQKPVEDFIQALTEVPGNLPTTYLFHRGDHRQPKQAVVPGDLTICSSPGERCDIAADDESLPTSGRRLAYARWLTSGRHPLVARVIVNRIWLHHFGRGLVDTPADFGSLGSPATHPQLLDWLAHEFMAQGWSLKKLHRLIMTSTVYRQASAAAADRSSTDSASALYGRWPVRRLDAEAVRDRLLATSGTLNMQMFGPSTAVQIDESGKVVASGKGDRRSIYIQVRRSQPETMLATFDAPVMETNCPLRPSSTDAKQALLLMNSEFILAQAASFAQRVIREASGSPAGESSPDTEDHSSTTVSAFPGPLAGQIAYAWQLAYGRAPTRDESALALSFLAKQTAALRAVQHAEPDLQAMTNLCHVLLGSNEFLYVD